MKDDFLFIEDLELPCRIGTTPEERAFPQILWITLEIGIPLGKAGRSDDFSDTADYAEFIKSARQIASSREFNLLESLAESIANAILSHPLITSVRVKIRKHVFAGVGAVGAFISRNKTPRN